MTRYPAPTAPAPKIVLVGNPNVGKSVLFNALTGAYTTVSNYPGTSVEVSRGHCVLGGRRFEVLDTPGMYSLLPITEEERVARKILLVENAHVVVHVVDARNLDRMLTVTLQLIEAGLPVLLVVNIMDEAERIGMTIGIMPITGLPLPFVSYGGSSLVITLASVGILLNIARGNAGRAAAEVPDRGRGNGRTRRAGAGGGGGTASQPRPAGCFGCRT